VPARQSLFVLLIKKREDLPRAIALNSTIFNGSRFVGPAIGGIILNLFGPAFCFWTDAISYLAVLTGLKKIKVKESPKSKLSFTQFFKSFKEGIHYASSSSLTYLTLGLVASNSFLIVFAAVASPIFARDIFHGDAQTLGYLSGIVGCGTFISAIIFLQIKQSPKLLRFLPSGAALTGLGLMGYGCCNHFYQTILPLFCAGLGASFVGSSANIALQSVVSDAKRGRIMSLFTMCFYGFMPFGNLAAGYLISHTGVRTALEIAGATCLITALLFVTQLSQFYQKFESSLKRHHQEEISVEL
jgi:predicted MFS family arabinose efflux permease